MGPRPAPLNLNSARDDGDLPPPRFPGFHMDLPSPRAGDTPPALSPLDAFALHSRMLAKKFDEEAEAGRRLSRLSHKTVAQEMANRPNYFRAQKSTDGMSDISESQEDSLPNTRGGLAVNRNDAPRDRPQSTHPMLGRASRMGNETERIGTPNFDSIAEHQQRSLPAEQPGYFAMPRALTPEPVDPRVKIEAPSPMLPSLTSSVESLSHTHARSMERAPRNYGSERNLLPLRSPMLPRSPKSMQSIRAVGQDSGEDDNAYTNGGPYAAVRKYSGSSGISMPPSPFTPSFVHHAHRSPSMNSEYSLTGFSHSPRPAMNFSRPDRPMSPEGRTSMDTRQSSDSRRSFESRPSADVLNRQSSMASSATQLSQQSPPRKQQSERMPKPFANEDNASDSDTGQTYTYSSFTLPRGRGVERNSMGLRTSWIEKQITWDNEGNTDDPKVQPVFEHGRKSSEVLTRPVIPAAERPSSPASIQVPFETRRGREHSFTSAHRSHSADPRVAVRPKALHTPSASIATDSTERTIKPSPLQQRELSSEVSAEDHLEIGIQAHSAGQTNKSTYHLRLAANAGLPTAMLLYALACRHGWGMRANQEEGVRWLRKAIDTSKLEEQDVDRTLLAASRRSGILDPTAELAERKKRKAQFSLAIYELGMSYMKGWGCPKDKVLALRCYEIAGDWGDCDALAEAGYCYTQGLGCKKDMHKAAALYRKAACLGMSMTGNSWIYKDKYMETTVEQPKKSIELVPIPAKEPEKRARSRSIWGRPKKEKS
ncbi:hypothetical protein AMS68_001366 [Peltaster fructicola]|uniref:Mitosis inhibitor nif1 n=1 Tax=Peltaster fructicola TaxID=286661 RepID=A0A6H0XMJ5_9PEZI|nr:hypothetical protein AMS68_001366 [Peltaster fructicola]